MVTRLRFPEKDGVVQVVLNKCFGNEITAKININSFIKLYRDKKKTPTILQKMIISLKLKRWNNIPEKIM